VPNSSAGAILVTARKQVFATSTVANDGLELGKLTDAEGTEMILRQIQDHAGGKTEETKTEARKVVARVAGLPLGIQAAIGLINESHLTLKQYNQKYTDGRTFLRAVERDHTSRPFDPYPQGLRETLNDTIKSLGGSTRRLLEIFSLLDPDHIQDRLWEAATENDTLRTFDYVKNATDYLPSLYNSGIVRNVDEVGQRLTSVRMHRLLQDCVRLFSSDDSFQQTFEHAVIMVDTAMGSTYFKTAHQTAPQQLREYLPHVQMLHDFYHAQLTEGRTHKIIPTMHFIRLLRKSAT